jgi:hypothetical protein
MPQKIEPMLTVSKIKAKTLIFSSYFFSSCSRDILLFPTNYMGDTIVALRLFNRFFNLLNEAPRRPAGRDFRFTPTSGGISKRNCAVAIQILK